MNSYLEGWEVILIVINGVVHCKNMSKRSATNWSAILHSVTFSAQHSLMWIALQSSTPKYPGILECSTQGVALRNALNRNLLTFTFRRISAAQKVICSLHNLTKTSTITRIVGTARTRSTACESGSLRTLD